MANTTLPAHVVLPPAPDGLSVNKGSNRPAQDASSLQARDDREAIMAWLSRVADSEHTRASYLKEADRLYRWAVFARGKLVSSLTHEDLELYRRFLANPQPAAVWVGTRRVGRHHPDWRPFSGPLSESSVRQALTIVNSMFSWLVEARYLAANPLSLARKRRGKGAPRLTRLIGRQQIDACFDAVGALPCETELERRHVSRCRWLLQLFLLSGLRISEVTGTRMGAFYFRQGQGKTRWWLDVVGKGEKARQIPVNDEMLAELRQYRESLDLPALPSPGEDLPLVLKVRGLRSEPMTRQAIHTILKTVFRLASDRLTSLGRGDEARALELASAHWLRHTAGSMMGDAGIDIRTIKANFGHSSLSTTSIYLHKDDDHRHDETASHSLTQPDPDETETLEYWKARAEALEALVEKLSKER
ncbi:integrase [Crenobacter cavernae]|uniref:Integrase n=2 Tax=Crenobacter cavernae TaxID=2290923 RepID=A0A345Y8P4_9NEIS|nr:integrase [Crenobacter cavernae]